MLNADLKKLFSHFKQRSPFEGICSEEVRSAFIELMENSEEVKKVWLCGSYSTNRWINETSPMWAQKIFLKYKKRLSDVDFIAEGNIVEGKKYDLIKRNFRSRKILIYNELYNTEGEWPFFNKDN